MDVNEYQKLYKGLQTPEDLDRFLAEGYDRNLLETLYNQKVNRIVKKRYHIVKKNSARILRQWQKGMSIIFSMMAMGSFDVSERHTPTMEARPCVWQSSQT